MSPRLVAAALPFLLACTGTAVPAASPAGTEPAEPLRTDTAARACVATAAEVCLNARDDNCNGLIDEGCGVTTGLVQFVIAWSAGDADVDLLVTDPNGELVEVGATPESGLVKERDCPGRSGACNGKNVENVFLEADRDLIRGTYNVRIRLEKMGNGDAPVVVNFGARLGPKVHSAHFTFTHSEQEKSLQLVL